MSIDGGAGITTSDSDGGGDIIYYVKPELVIPADITTDTAIANTGEGHVSTLLDAAEFESVGLRADVDFVTKWTGGFDVTFGSGGLCMVMLHVVHANDRGLAFTHTRTASMRIQGDTVAHFDMTRFDRFSSVELREYDVSEIAELTADADFTLTEADLQNPVQISYTVELQSATRQGARNVNTMKSLVWDSPQVRNWQVRF